MVGDLEINDAEERKRKRAKTRKLDQDENPTVELMKHPRKSARWGRSRRVSTDGLV